MGGGHGKGGLDLSGTVDSIPVSDVSVGRDDAPRSSAIRRGYQFVVRVSDPRKQPNRHKPDTVPRIYGIHTSPFVVKVPNLSRRFWEGLDPR